MNETHFEKPGVFFSGAAHERKRGAWEKVSLSYWGDIKQHSWGPCPAGLVLAPQLAPFKGAECKTTAPHRFPFICLALSFTNHFLFIVLLVLSLVYTQQVPAFLTCPAQTLGSPEITPARPHSFSADSLCWCLCWVAWALLWVKAFFPLWCGSPDSFSSQRC